ncbi:hypothetical protein QFZ82_007933 [Streptomyces sp. V4I23]|uniref:hypothetical protein n=1 Tax=Streptomyces sp. V4I23 TaxID=3042282 RepID=UPI0027848C64|nr:hypothetical protein [Streptomyces sp. V4I23]MDQ1005520.1 hypothetical protein [Streptomyces sp. V4I23]MDQ1005747.1 hypothetical protein [Streptomyces sp. V4I23]MDQ1006003.1 hypothetical protein [Streptomyces sp. V4I23]MDQ1013365.1 hypothetical protein [Streptomyces sp. V4I23]
MSRIIAVLLTSAASIAGVTASGAVAPSASEPRGVVAGDGFGWGTGQILDDGYGWSHPKDTTNSPRQL